MFEVWMKDNKTFKIIDIVGCEIGNFSRDDDLTKEDYEMFIIAEF